MALTRKMLKAMGIEEEKIEQIIDAHTETVDALKESVSQYKEKAQKADGLQKALDEANEKLGDPDNSEWEDKYKALEKEYADYKEEIKNKEVVQAKETAYKKLLTDAGVSEKRIDTILKVTDLSKMEFAKGEFKESDKLVETIKEEWADFIEKKPSKNKFEDVVFMFLN